MKGGQSTQAILGNTSFSKNEKLYQKKPLHLLDPLKYLSLNYQQNILEKNRICWLSCNCSKLEKQSTWTYHGQEIHLQPFPRTYPAKCCCNFFLLYPNTYNHAQHTKFLQFLDRNWKLLLSHLLLDIEAVTFGPYTLKQCLIFSPETKSINTEICSKNSSWNK